MNATSYLPAAVSAAKIIHETLLARGADTDAITQWKLTEENGEAWLFGIINPLAVRKFTPYVGGDTLHHISTSLQGLPVVVSNSTGLRYAVLLSQTVKLPERIEYPGPQPGVLRWGVNERGEEISVAWRELGHVMLAGMTDYGKSNAVRLVAAQAIADGHQLAIMDAQNRTLPRLAGHPQVIAHARRLFEADSVILAVMAEYERRIGLFDQTSQTPDDLDEYNAITGQRLPRLVVIIEEFCGLIETYGLNSSLYSALKRLAWESRKYGVHLVAAGQAWNANIAGAIRDQMKTRICFRVANGRQSSIVLLKTGAESLSRPGRALAMPWGKLQTYYVGQDYTGGYAGNVAAPAPLAPLLRPPSPVAPDPDVAALAEQLRPAWEGGERNMSRLAESVGQQNRGRFYYKLLDAVALLRSEDAIPDASVLQPA